MYVITDWILLHADDLRIQFDFVLAKNYAFGKIPLEGLLLSTDVTPVHGESNANWEAMNSIGEATNPDL